MSNFFTAAQEYGYGLPFILVISVIVFVHEFGHYWVARRCGIRVVSFSIGFGKPIFGWTDKHGTRWQVAWLPLGGYVKMFGDADPASSPDPAVKTMGEEEKKVAFFHQSVEKRIAVVAAGPAFNYIFAVVVLALLFMFQGQPFSPPTVGEVQENSAAQQAGILAGDRILSIDGHKVERFEDIKRMVGLNTGSAMPFVVARGGGEQTLSVTPQITVQTDHFGGEHRMGKIGVVSDKIEYKKWPMPTAIGHAAQETWTLTVDTLKAIGQMIVGSRGSDEIGGPIKIAQMSGQVAHNGIWALIWFMAVISVNLGLINLFPVPLLDGGHLVFYFYEKLFGHPMHEKAQEVAMRIGLVLIVSLMVFATSNDLGIPALLHRWFS